MAARAKNKIFYCDPNVNKQLDKIPTADSLNDWYSVSPQIIVDSSHFLITSHNCEGYFPHYHDIKNNSFFHQADIIALQETWTSPNDRVQPPNTRYQAVFAHRMTHQNNQSPQGGVAIFVHEDFDFIQIDTSMADIECVAVHITSPPVSVLNVYKPPQTNLHYFCEQLTLILNNLPTSETIVLGDFNTQVSANELQQTMIDFDQLITTPTTVRQTLIDHIYVKNLAAVQSGTVPTYYSYHAVTYANIQI